MKRIKASNEALQRGYQNRSRGVSLMKFRIFLPNHNFAPRAFPILLTSHLSYMRNLEKSEKTHLQENDLNKIFQIFYDKLEQKIAQEN